MSGRIRGHRRVVAVVAGVASTMLIGSVAFAYWTGGGAGEGKASVAGSAASVVVHQDDAQCNGQKTAGVDPADFVIYGDAGIYPLAIDKVLPALSTNTHWSGLYLAINNDNQDKNPDALKGLTVTIEYTLSAAPAGS